MSSLKGFKTKPTADNVNLHFESNCDKSAGVRPPVVNDEENSSRVVSDCEAANAADDQLSACDDQTDVTTNSKDTAKFDNNDDGFTEVVYRHRKRNPSSYADAVVNGKSVESSVRN